MDGGDVKSRARGERGYRDLTVGRGERLEQVERSIDGLHRPTGPLRRGGAVFRLAQLSLYHVKG